MWCSCLQAGLAAGTPDAELGQIVDKLVASNQDYKDQSAHVRVHARPKAKAKAKAAGAKTKAKAKAAS